MDIKQLNTPVAENVQRIIAESSLKQLAVILYVHPRKENARALSNHVHALLAQ